MNRLRHIGILTPIVLLVISGFSLLAFRDGEMNAEAFRCCGILTAMLIAHYVLFGKLFRRTDRDLLAITYTLTAVGMIMQFRLNPETAATQLVWVALGMAASLFVLVGMNAVWTIKKMNFVLCAVSLLLLTVVLLVGRRTGGARNWIDMGAFSFQPSEFVKLALVFFLASELSAKRTIARLLPAALFTAACVGLLVAARDLGAALIYSLTVIAMYYAATGNTIATFAGLSLGAGAAVVSYGLFDHVRIRVEAWRNPWTKYDTNGYQIAQGLMAIASGGMLGLGLGLGTPKIIPAYSTDYIFAVICEEMGLVAGVIVIALTVLFALKGLMLARSANTAYIALIAAGISAAYFVQAFLIIGGVIKLIPLTGVTLPFVSYGGSSMIASYMMLGVLEGIARINGREAESA